MRPTNPPDPRPSLFHHIRGCGKFAFTLVELLVVIGIVSVLAALLLPALNKARQQAVQVQCMSNVRQVAAAMIMYANDNGGMLPGVIEAGQPGMQYSLNDRLPAFALDASYNGGYPFGSGLLLYWNYLKDIKALFCPGRGDPDEFSADVSLNPSKRNIGPVSANPWNPGQNYVAGNAYGEVGYYTAVSDRPPAGTSNPVSLDHWHKLGKCHPDTPMVLEVFGWKNGPEGLSQAHHGPGYNIALFDGSANFYPDAKDVLERSFAIRGNSTWPTGLLGGMNAAHGPFDFTAGTPDRWDYYPLGTTAAPIVAGTHPNGIAWVEHFMLGWPDARIQENTPN